MHVSTLFRLGGVVAAAATLSACAPGGQPYMSADAQRAALGAVGGAVAAKAFDENIVAGAALGATAGALCDDAGVCASSGY
ncbi:hypothetical protein [Paracoccus jiaweipingae]|uniref:hypothetical protein n=1 Tax=unclassified Paracoccus (in: a-proteobacteria) TaxID=2688777 RepID=UPI0037B988E3